MIATMTRLTMVVLIGAVLMTTVFADPDFVFYNEDEMMPGVSRRAVSTRFARTPSPDSAIHFPGPSVGGALDPVGIPPPETSDTLELPFDVNELDVTSLNRLNTITNISDFADLFNLALPESPLTAAASGGPIGPRFGNTNDEGVKLPSANCKPELVTVTLDLPTEANTMFFPTCIRLEQCGGCCFGPLLTCRPSVTKAVKVKVLKVNSARNSRGGRRHRRRNPSTYHVVEAIKHTACKCGCKVQEEDCNSNIHTYFEGECSCVCKNKDEKRKCENQNSTKYWDNKTCSCYCRKPLECGSGEFFSQNSCSCERLAARSGVLSFGSEDTWSIPVSTRRRPKPVRVPLK